MQRISVAVAIDDIEAKLAKNRQIKLRNCLILTAFFIILTIGYHYCFRLFPRSSDDAATFLAGQEMSEGNWRLQGWWLPRDTFLTPDIFFYATMIKLFGFAPQLMVFLPAMLWSGVALLSIVLAKGGAAQLNTKFTVATAATPILLPVIWYQRPASDFLTAPGITLISHPGMHVGTILYVLLCFLFVKKILAGSSHHSGAQLVAYSIIMFLAALGDPLAIFVGAIPVMVVAVYSACRFANNGPNRSVLMLTILAVTAANLLLKLNSLTHGLQLIPLGAQFVRYGDLGGNIAWTFHFFFGLFGCDFFGKRVTGSLVNGPALPLIRLPFLVLLTNSLVLVGKRFFVTSKKEIRQSPLREQEYLGVLLAVAFTINVLAVVFSTEIEDDHSIRYLFPSLVFGTILIAQLELRRRWLAVYFEVAFFTSFAISLIAYMRYPEKGALTSKDIAAVSRWLSESDLTNGFGPYWSSAIITAATENRIKVRALGADSVGLLKPFEWMANKNWYKDPIQNGTSSIFVLTQEASDSYPEADVLRTFGEPIGKRKVGSFTIHIYDASNERLSTVYIR